MPNAYVQKMATKHKISINAAEDKWKKAKEAAEKAGHKDNPEFYAVVTKIFQKMIGENTLISFEDYLNGRKELSSE